MFYWPLFGLRIRTERLELRLPTDPDLFELVAVALAGVHDPAQMPFLEPWTQTPSPGFERGFLQYHWSTRANWRPESWQLELGVWAEGRAAGAQAISAGGFAEHRSVSTGSWLGLPFQGRGYGKEMRSAVLAFAFEHLGAEMVTTSAFTDNAASIAVSRSLGYEETGVEHVETQGQLREAIGFLMTRDLWQARERPVVLVEGLEECREFFGV
ncbi:MAG TPA: GNAT family protein [Candidatus Limnocylindrales bacterium]|nr:GNAT family protein [Candidatus Limnocylindrales bacterium]